MSAADVELLLRVLDAFNRGDVEAAWDGAWAEDAEWHPYLGSVEASVYRGREEITRLWAQMREHLGLRIEVGEIADLDGQVVAEVRATGTGSGSGAAVEAGWAQIYTMRDGRVTRAEAFETFAEALAEARRRSAG